MKKRTEEDIITSISPHSIKKFELIKKYVDEWSRKILGIKKSRGIVFVDCSSNSGVYKDKSGNLVNGTAILVAKLLNQVIQNYPGKKAVLFFNDISEARISHLKKTLEEVGCENLDTHFSTMDRNNFLKQFELDIYKDYNVLMIYDPYKATICWDAVAPFLNIWGEVIINHMILDTARGAAQAKKPEVIEKYQETYQQDIVDIVAMGSDVKKLDGIVKRIIRNQSTKTYQSQYIASAPFFNTRNGHIYDLIYCSRHIKGLVLFKKVAWQTFGGKSSLKDTHENQNQICMDFSSGGEVSFATDDSCYYVHNIAEYVYKKYSSRGKVPMKEIYFDLDRHPIFPSEGYKRALKSELKSVYNVTFPRKGKVEMFQTKKG